MEYAYVLLSFFLLTVVHGYDTLRAEDVPPNTDLPLCPLAGEIYPCTCYFDTDLSLPDMYCSNIESLEQLMDIFTTANFPTKRFWRIRLSGASLGALPQDVFADVQFDEVRLTSCSITAVHPDAFRASQPNMDTLELYSNNLTDTTFPWHILGNYTKLWRVLLHHNYFTEFPVLESLALEQIMLWENPITTLERNMLVGAPNLRIINVTPDLAQLSPDAFLDLTSLEDIDFDYNKIGDLAENSITLNSESFAYLRLNNNGIASIHPAAITGVMGYRLKVFLEDNLLETLDEAVFAPLMDHMVDGWGELDVAGNPLACDCSMYWLLSNSTRLANVRSGDCADGTPLQEVDVSEWQC